MGPKPISTYDFILRAKQIHNNRFIYNLTNYVNRRTPIVIECRIHGEFSTTCKTHLNGKGGCPKCSKITEIRARKNSKLNSANNSTTTASSYKVFSNKCKKFDNTYINIANKIHNNKYKYKLNTPISNIETHKFTITCSVHGDFMQTIKNHLQGQGCPECGKLKAKKPTSFTEFTSKASAIHGNKFTYNASTYKNFREKTEIYCVECKNTFKQTPDGHINQKQGCPYCKGMYKTMEAAYNALSAINQGYKLSPTHNFADAVYSNTMIKFICPTHGETSRKFSDLQRGLGCRNCKTNGFSITKPGTLYYVSVDNGTAYKIGITNKEINKRFYSKDFIRIKVIKEWHFDDGYECYMQEQNILKEFKPYKYTGKPLLSNGNSELFYTDVLNLDLST